MKGDVYGDWYYIPNGERISWQECMELTFLKTYLWGDVFHHMYEREEDRKLFVRSEMTGLCKEGVWIKYCYLPSNARVYD
jgi:hypothetical protein